MIPQPRNWKVTFHKQGKVHSTTVWCVKRFAKSLANEQLGYIAFFSDKITVSLIK